MSETIRIEIPIETVDKTDPALSNIIDKFVQLAETVKQVEQSARHGGQQVSSSMRQAANGVKNTGSAMKQARDRVSEFDRSVEKNQKSLMKWVRQKYQVLLEAKDRISPIVSMASTKLKMFAGRTWRVTMRAIDMVTSPIKKILGLLKSPLLAAGITLSVGVAFVSTVKTFAGFEEAMSKVEAISGAGSEEMARLTDKAEQMGATTKFTATEAAEGFNYMAMAGWKSKDMLDGIDGIMNLAAASGEDLATTSDIVTDALTAFGLQASDSTHFSDVLAATAANANTNVALMGETFKYVGTMAGSMGYKIEDVSLAVGLMANSSLKGSMAGTALNSIMTRLATNTRGATDAIKAIGVEFFNQDGSARGFKTVMDELRIATKDMTDEEKSSLAKKVAGVEAQKGLLAILNATTEDYEKLEKAVNSADGASKRMADTMLDNLSGKFTLLKSAIDGVKISLGKRFEPYLRDFLVWLTSKMPDVEDVLLRTMDNIERKIGALKKKIGEFTSTDEWKNADLFGKIGIAWDELIAQPFNDWWSSTGKAWLASKANEIGQGIGGAINHGVMALFGIDVGSAGKEGLDIGKSFAAGFAEGIDFDAIKEKLWEGLGNMFSSAGKLLPGGKAPDLGSLVSAYFLTKLAKPLLFLGGKGIGAGQAVAASARGGLLSRALGSFSLAGEVAGTGIAGGSGIIGMLGKVGMALGSGATTSAGMVAAGGSAVAGGVAATATLISAGKDFYRGFKTEDEKEKNAYVGSGVVKAGAVGTGALIGASIGTVIPGIGNLIGGLIGAGIGGIVGSIAGDKLTSDYEKEKAFQAAKDAELNRRAQVEQLQSKFESVEMKNAIEAVSKNKMTEAELNQVFLTSVAKNLESHFGKMKLSITEIKDAARMIVFDDQERAFNSFSEAAGKAEGSIQSMKNAVSTMERLNWKVGLGMELSESDMEEYKAGADNLLESAKKYLEDQHYEATAAIDLLVEPGKQKSLTKGLNKYYEANQKEIERLSKKLNNQWESAMEDNKLSPKEQEKIEETQNEITKLTNMETEANNNAVLKMLAVKHNGAALDYDSFAALQAELGTQADTMAQAYDQAYTVGVSNLQLELQNKSITRKQFEKQMKILTDGYTTNLEELRVRVGNIQLESIAEAYATELDGILPDIEGTTAEKINTALNRAISNGADVKSWNTEEVVKWFGLNGLSEEAKFAVAERLQQYIATIPELALQALQKNSLIAGNGLAKGKHKEIDQAMQEQEHYKFFTGSADKSPGKAFDESLAESLENVDLAQTMEAINKNREKVGTELDTAFASGFEVNTRVNITADYHLTNPNVSFSGNGTAVNILSKEVDGGGSKKVSGNATAYANGGLVNGAELSWVGEDGPEAIIPLGAKRRSRGLALWMQAGEQLGVLNNANGSIIGRSIPSHIDYGMQYFGDMADKTQEAMILQENDAETYQNAPVNSQKGQRQDVNVDVSVSVNPTFEINGGNNEERVVSIIKAHIREMADELGEEMADRLADVFSNMPVVH